MATLFLAMAGAQLGGVLGPLGVIGGRIAGAILGTAIDQHLFGERSHSRGPRLKTLEVTSSTEGAPVPRVYGRARIGGQVIWATNLEEVISTRTEKVSSKGLAPQPTTTTFSYYANLAIGLCEGEIARVARVWADGKPVDLTKVTMRVHRGTATQNPDPLIVAKEGSTNAPAYRGMAYVVFERLPLRRYGNRIPQFSFEVIRPVGDLERMVRAVTLIPGATEYGYAPVALTREIERGEAVTENRHVAHAESDLVAALDDLQALCPNLERVALVVSWFGTDLRAGNCLIRPQVDRASKRIDGDAGMADWRVSGLTRETAAVVSEYDGSPAYGGTPSDRTVIAAIREIKARGLKVTFYPFVMMDVPTGNTLPDPWTGTTGQPAYPWRGQITCSPAPDRPGTVDGTAAAATQVNALFGAATAVQFTASGEDVAYAGPAEWTLRRMAFHYARLCQIAGGVDAFVIASELAALTRVRSGSSAYPAVDQLKTIAAGVRSIMGLTTTITYASDWTEYGAHVRDGGATVRFPLDALWSDPNIDAVGIDYYAPLADWRDGETHLDHALASSIHDRAYLAGNLTRGEDYDWFYANDAARLTQTRTPIIDGAAGKPWVFRAKDIWSWWASGHKDRDAGVEAVAMTGWVPQSKPVWLTEFGCGAVDKGANRPSVFPDAKSSTGGLPPFSNGARDDLMQRRTLEAVLGAFDPAFGATTAMNPVSTLTGNRMVDPSALHLWTWDARPYPAFPAALDVWSDGANWETGHWLNGRLGTAPLDALVRAILTDHGMTSFDATALAAPVDGYVLDEPMSARAALEPLAAAYQFNGLDRAGSLVLRPRGAAPVAELAVADLVEEPDKPATVLTRAQETELPRQVTLSFTDEGQDYRVGAVASRRLAVGSTHTISADLPVVTSDAEAERRAEVWLQALWAGREEARFALPPARLPVEPGDTVALTVDGRRRLYEITEIADETARRIKAVSVDPGVFRRPPSRVRRRTPDIAPARGKARVEVLDLPRLPGDRSDILQRVAVFAKPWPDALAVWRAVGTGTFERIALVEAPSMIGETLDSLPAGPRARWDHAASVRVKMSGGALSSASDAAVFAGANALALRRADGALEVVQFAHAELVGTRTWKLSRLLRGQAGSEQAMGAPLPAGSPAIVLDTFLTPVADRPEEIGRAVTYRIVAADLDHADNSRVEITTTVGTRAVRPLAPVHLKARRDADGVWFSWTRRSRIGADSWETIDVPLDEPVERYEIDVMDGVTVKRTLSADLPSVLYPAAAELADFGTAQTSLTIRVSQVSRLVGRGDAALATIVP